MARTRAGLDRIIKRETTAIAVWAEGRMQFHHKNCPTCSKAGTDPYAHCARWWDAARLAHTARRELEKYQQDAPWNQPTLPGMENLDDNQPVRR